ncbi:MAG: hypothetical protein ACI9MC_002917, partial [Kiritimatiellia bacterium]
SKWLVGWHFKAATSSPTRWNRRERSALETSVKYVGHTRVADLVTI